MFARVALGVFIAVVSATSVFAITAEAKKVNDCVRHEMKSHRADAVSICESRYYDCTDNGDGTSECKFKTAAK